MLSVVDGLESLAARQAGVCTLRQLTNLGMRADAVQRQVAARRWQRLSSTVVVMWTGPLDRQARRWAAVLQAGPGAALCAWTALEEWGLQGWHRSTVHVVVGRGVTFARLPFMTVHESRRHNVDAVTTRNGLSLHQVERAAVDAGAWADGPRAAAGVLAAVVQQRLTTPGRLMDATETVGRVRHLRVMQRALVDIEGGARAMSEIDMARLCRRAGLPEPRRQRRRRDAAGRWRYLDVEWRINGRRVLLEIDGIGHLDVERWYDDLMRAAEITRPGEVLVRLPAMAARLEPDRVVTILRVHLVGPPSALRGWIA